MIVGGRVTTLKRCRMRPTEPADRVRHVGHDALCEVEVAVALGLSRSTHGGLGRGWDWEQENALTDGFGILKENG